MFTIVGDPHLKNSNLEIAEQLFKEVENLGRSVIWLGDMLDTKEVIRGKCLNALLTYFRQSKLMHVVLVGNHDWFNLECEAHSLESLKSLPNVVVVDALQVEEHNGIFTPSAFVPYIHDQEKLRATLAQIPDGYNVFAHLDISGFDYGNGHISTTGLRVEELARFNRVISGHFHKYQQNGNLTYLGTPFSHSFGEANQRKYLGIFNPDDNQLRLEETIFPRHVSIEINCDKPEQPKDWQAATQDDKYRVVLTGSRENIDQFNRAELAHLNVKFVTRPTELVLNDVQIDETASNEVQFVKWATDVKGLDQATIEQGLRILEAVK